MSRRTVARGLAFAMPFAVTAAMAGLHSGPARAHAPEHQQARPTCHGKPATLVGKRGQTVHGTGGNDVIVARGDVNAGAGNDLICELGFRTLVDAGRGNDVVDATGVKARGVASANLGPGNDRYLGGPADDYVDPGVTEPGESDNDVVDTRGGNDFVGSFDQTPVRPAGFDKVKLGTGNDRYVEKRLGLHTTVNGGPGRDVLVPPADRLHPLHDYVYDNVRHGAFRDGARALTWTSMESFDLTAVLARHARFQGGPGAETIIDYPGINVDSPPGDPTLLVVATGGGNDLVLTVRGRLDLSAGAGRDTLDYYVNDYHQSATFDLQRGQIDGPGLPTSSVSDVERLIVSRAGQTTIIGTDRSEALIFRFNCGATVHGGGGDDYITDKLVPDEVVDEDYPGDCSQVQLYGEGGDDHLVGGLRDDLLVGGPGRDVADGNGGSDQCDAETTEDCP